MLALLLAPLALAGDLWMTVESTDEAVSLELPANWLAEEEAPVSVTLEDGDVDLRELAREIRDRKEGAKSSMVVGRLSPNSEPVEIVIAHRGTVEPAVTGLEMAVLGPQGNGLTFSLPLDGSEARRQLEGNLVGVPAKVDDAFQEQLRRAPPTTLARIASDEGSFVLRTR